MRLSNEHKAGYRPTPGVHQPPQTDQLVTIGPVVPMTVQATPPKQAKTAAGASFALQKEVNEAIGKHRDGLPYEYLSPEGIQQELAKMGDTSAPDYLAASRDLPSKRHQDEVASRASLRASLSANGSAEAGTHIRRLERTLQGCEQAEVLEACRQAMISAPSDAAKAAIADELPSIMASKGVSQTEWIEPELSRAVAPLAAADDRINNLAKVTQIANYNALVIEQGLRNGQPARHLVDPSKYDIDAQ
jgi:hypothetical protein